MKLHWLSNAPWGPTGYGNQTKVFCHRFVKNLGHDVAITAFWGLEGAPLTIGVGEDKSIVVYPRGNDPYGLDVAAANTAHSGAKLLISLTDAWVLDPELLQLHGIRWVPWYPVDHEILPPFVKKKVEKAFARIVFSRHGERMTNEAGLDCYYVPHGVDTKGEFFPVEDDLRNVRANLGWPQDKFVVGMVAANKGSPSRKAFPENLRAFAEFRKRHADVHLYLHTHPSTAGEHQGFNIPAYMKFLGLEDGVDWSMCDPYTYSVFTFKTEYMQAAYSAMDVHLLVSMGEGFGIPIVEAQACGTPVIVGDWTAMSELCFAGWKVSKKDATPWYTPMQAYQYFPRWEAILDCLEQAYRTASSKRKAARKGALAYDADKVTEKYWRPVLADLDRLVYGN